YCILQNSELGERWAPGLSPFFRSLPTSHRRPELCGSDGLAKHLALPQTLEVCRTSPALRNWYLSFRSCGKRILLSPGSGSPPRPRRPLSQFSQELCAAENSPRGARRAYLPARTLGISPRAILRALTSHSAASRSSAATSGLVSQCCSIPG